MSGSSSAAAVTVVVEGLRPLFTPVQWQELEHQALIYKYLIAGLPVPSELVLPIRRSLEALPTRFLHHSACKNGNWGNDIPDVDGDRDFGIQSFSVSLGQKRVFWLCIGILLTAYASALVIGASSSFLLSKLVTVIGHCTLASILWYRANSVNLEDNASVTSFYMSIWKMVQATVALEDMIKSEYLRKST